MATQQYASVWAHATDADFRAWASEFSTNLQAAGLVKTADTGQINFVTVTRPGTSTAAGYEIYRFNDTLQATAPIFFKIEYGTGGSAASPGIFLTVGTGTNGAGTLTGTISTRIKCHPSSQNIVSTVTPYNTQMCVKDGFVGVSMKQGAMVGGRQMIGFLVGRTVDSTGAETATGCAVSTYVGSTASGPTNVNFQTQSLTFSPSRVGSQGSYACMVPGDVTASLVGADPQVYQHYGEFPAVTPLLHWATVMTGEITAGTTFSVALIGATARTYLSLGQYWIYGSASGNAGHSLAMLWE